jgi:hypothetical protein
MHDVVAGKFRRLSRQIARSRPGDKLPCASLCARLSEVHHQPYGADDAMFAFKHMQRLLRSSGMEASVDALEDTSRMTSDVDVDWTLYTQKPITNFINLLGLSLVETAS